ncbi:type II toxin-antitoxin system RelB/DinJ family antitoxin [Chakrabartyella piscis]|uniref:type II toxin-antitoxin system RelB/DinJ family antitoxin n=1 Tax=Chakrabartyella piscis TaxID=2918914 RepID=UPI0029587454|nr:type II toxin-antitoxin system RelB/DinJ family antitoxin [Chakrabartyella piscis]
MAQTTLSIRMDENVKKQFDTFCSEVGINTSVAINMFAKTVIREQRIPFDIALKQDPFYNEANMARLKQSIAQMEATGGTVHELIEVSDD